MITLHFRLEPLRLIVAAVLLGVYVLLTSGCAKTAQESKPSSNAAITVELLFEHEGVRMYRFSDGGRYRYYAVPKSGAWATTTWDESCGKNCTTTLELPLVSTLAAGAR